MKVCLRSPPFGCMRMKCKRAIPLISAYLHGVCPSLNSASFWSQRHTCECIMHNCDCIVLSTKSVNKQTLYKHLPEYSKLLLLVHTMTSLQYPGILKNTLSSSSGFREIPIHRMKCKHRLSRACQGNRRRYYLFRKTTLASQKDAKQRRKARKTLVFLSTHKH